MTHRYAARTDANKREIVDALRAAGALVYDLKMPVDLMVYRRAPGDVFGLYPGRLILMELKDGNKPPSARKHTKAQAEFLAAGWPMVTVTDVDEAIAALTA